MHRFVVLGCIWLFARPFDLVFALVLVVVVFVDVVVFVVVVVFFVGVLMIMMRLL